MEQKKYKPVPDVECLKYHSTPEKPDIKIFVSHRIDLDSETIDNPLYIPVRCGAVYDKRENISMLGDDTGENISERRTTFNEFTVLYWAWKNVEADYYGLCHYRRYIAFPESTLTPDPYGNVLFDSFDCDSVYVAGLLNQRLMRRTIARSDMIISEPYDVTYRNFANIREHYVEVPTQHAKDLEVAVQVIKDCCPEYLEAAEEYFNGKLFYPCNLFLMKREIFDEYCNWIFPILFELEKRIDITNYDETERRVVGFLGERLLGVFYLYYRKLHPQGNYLVLQRTLFLENKGVGTIRLSLLSHIKKIIPKDTPLYAVLKKVYRIFK